MEMGFESFAGRIGKRVTGSAGRGFDWHGLHSRLATAHTARRALLAEFAGQVPAEGSFDPASAQALGELEQHLIAVNLTDLADRKSDADKAANVAAAHLRGEQG